jgi:hypothetical protein
MSKKAFLEEFEKVIQEEVRSEVKSPAKKKSKKSSGLPIKKIPETKTTQEEYPESKGLSYSDLKDKIDEKNREILENIKSRKEVEDTVNQKEPNPINFDFFEENQGVENNIKNTDKYKIEEGSFEENDDLANFFKESTPTQQTKAKAPSQKLSKSKPNMLPSLILLFLAIGFFSFSTVSLYTSTNQDIEKYYELCLKDLDTIKPEVIKEKSLSCNKPKILDAIIDSKLVDKNYQENKRIISTLEKSDFIGQKTETELKIQELFEVLTVAKVEGLPNLQGIETKIKEEQNVILVKLEEIFKNTEQQTTENKELLRNLVLALDTVEKQSFLNFYEQIENTFGQSLVAKKPEIDKNLEDLKTLIREEKGQEFLDTAIKFKFLDNTVVKNILKVAKFENLEEYDLQVFQQKATNQRLLEVAKKNGYTNFGIAQASSLDKKNLLQPEANAAWVSMLAASQTKNSLTFSISSSYLKPSTLNNDFKTLLQSKSKTENILSEEQIQEGLGDEILLKSLKETLPAGLSPFSTGYAISLTNLTTQQKSWLTEDNYFNLKKFGFIPILKENMADTEGQKNENKLDIIFIPKLIDIFNNPELDLNKPLVTENF